MEVKKMYIHSFTEFIDRSFVHSFDAANLLFFLRVFAISFVKSITILNFWKSVLCGSPNGSSGLVSICGNDLMLLKYILARLVLFFFCFSFASFRLSFPYSSTQSFLFMCTDILHFETILNNPWNFEINAVLYFSQTARLHCRWRVTK